MVRPHRQLRRRLLLCAATHTVGARGDRSDGSDGRRLGSRASRYRRCCRCAAIPASRARPAVISGSALFIMVALVIGLFSYLGRGTVAPPGAAAPAPPSGEPTADGQAASTGSGSPRATSRSTTPEVALGDALGVPLLGTGSPPNTLVLLHRLWKRVAINGQPTATAMGAACGACGDDTPREGSALLNLGRSYKKFAARVGATDQSRTNEPVSIQIYSVQGQGSSLLYDKSFRIGESEDLELDVANVLQLKFLFRGPLGHVYAGVGNPHVYR